MVQLKYTGGGYGGWLMDIPSRDLTQAEVEKHGGEEFLLNTGLYVKVDQQKKKNKDSGPVFSSVEDLLEDAYKDEG